MDVNMVPCGLTVTAMAVFHPATSQLEFTTEVGDGAGNCSQNSYNVVLHFFGGKKCICWCNKQTNITTCDAVLRSVKCCRC